MESLIVDLVVTLVLGWVYHGLGWRGQFLREILGECLGEFFGL